MNKFDYSILVPSFTEFDRTKHYWYSDTTSMASRTIGKMYPIPLDDYPKLLRYKVSEKGIFYIEDLIREIYVENKELSLNKLTQLGLLLKTYICQTKRIDEEILFKEISDRAKKYGGVETDFLKKVIENLTMRDLMGPNPQYDPRIAIKIHQKSGIQ